MATDRRVDPDKLDAWIEMNTVVGQAPTPGVAFIYVDDLRMGLDGGFVRPDD